MNLKQKEVVLTSCQVELQTMKDDNKNLYKRYNLALDNFGKAQDENDDL